MAFDFNFGSLIGIQESDSFLIEELKKELANIKESINKQGVAPTVLDQLTKRSKTIQDALNNILSKKGVLTDAEKQEAYNLLQKEKREQIEAMNKQAKKRFYIYVGSGVLLIGLAVFLLRKKRG